MLTLTFVGLKLSGDLDWSWWWVLWPVWLQLGIVAACALVALGCEAADRIGEWSRR